MKRAMGSRTTVVGSPPVRLVQAAAGFGARGVVGSLCEEDFGKTTGTLLRAIAERLDAAVHAAD